MYYRILVASQRFHGHESLTYSSVDSLQLGQVVSVPLQRKTVLGIVESTAPKPTFATKNIINTWPVSLPEASLSLLKWLRKYYPAPLGLITELFYTAGIAPKIT